MRGLLALVATAAFMTGGCRTVADKMADAEHDAVASLPAGSTFVDRHVTSSSRLSHYRLPQGPDEAVPYVTAHLKAQHHFRGAGNLTGVDEIGLAEPEVTTMRFYRVPAPADGTNIEIEVRHET